MRNMKVEICYSENSTLMMTLSKVVLMITHVEQRLQRGKWTGKQTLIFLICNSLTPVGVSPN